MSALQAASHTCSGPLQHGARQRGVLRLALPVGRRTAASTLQCGWAQRAHPGPQVARLSPPAAAPVCRTAAPAAAQHGSSPRRTVSTAAAAAGAAPAGDQPSPPEGLFVKKVACLSLIFVGATIVYTILQSLRDALIVTSCGAEALPLISAFGVLPASILFIWYFHQLNERLDSRAVFHWALAPMVLFYGLFAAVLLPNADALQPTALAAKYCAQLPESLGCFVRVAANWCYTLYFILGELWGSVAISLLFWSVADDVCSVEEAKDVYPKLGILANFGLIAAGAFTRFVSLTLARDNEVLALQILTLSVIAMAGMMCGVKAYVDAAILPHVASHKGGHKKEARPTKQQAKEKGKQQKKKASAWELLSTSARIRNLTLMVMGYGISHKLFGFVWKGQMQALYPSKAAYATIMADVASFTGAATVGLMLVSKLFFQFLGWRGAALMTPLVMLASGAVFFAGSLCAPGSVAQGTALGVLLALGPTAGIVAQVFGRASKYSLFDPSKEMVFITMDKAEKEAGKAAVDVLGNQVAKTGGSLTMQAALLACGSMAAALPVTATCYVAVCLVWLNATLGLANSMGAQEEGGRVVDASVDSTPLLQPTTPGILLPAMAPGGPGAAYVPGANPQLDKEVKESLQSHFD